MPDFTTAGPCSQSPETHAPHIRFRLLGALSIRVGGVAYGRKLAGPARELLIYLLAHPDRHHRREALAETIWGEMRAPSRGSFNTTLWRLKRFLSALNGPVLSCDATSIRLDLPTWCEIDSAQLANSIRVLRDCPQKLTEEMRCDLTNVTDAWRGPFADGELSDWLLEERERVHDAYMRALVILMRDAGARGRNETALELCHRILHHDPFRENIHCEMLWLLVLTGQRARAIQRHMAFCGRLKAEMDIRPMAETTALFEYIHNALEDPSSCASTCGTYADVMRSATETGATSRAELKRAKARSHT